MIKGTTYKIMTTQINFVIVFLLYSLELISYGTIFFSHNKSANSTFQPGFSVKRMGNYQKCPWYAMGL
jgi:hypothetical protein